MFGKYTKVTQVLPPPFTHTLKYIFACCLSCWLTYHWSNLHSLHTFVAKKIWLFSCCLSLSSLSLGLRHHNTFQNDHLSWLGYLWSPVLPAAMPTKVFRQGTNTCNYIKDSYLNCFVINFRLYTHTHIHIYVHRHLNVNQIKFYINFDVGSK